MTAVARPLAFSAETYVWPTYVCSTGRWDLRRNASFFGALSQRTLATDPSPPCLVSRLLRSHYAPRHRKNACLRVRKSRVRQTPKLLLPYSATSNTSCGSCRTNHSLIRSTSSTLFVVTLVFSLSLLLVLYDAPPRTRSTTTTLFVTSVFWAFFHTPCLPTISTA